MVCEDAKKKKGLYICKTFDASARKLRDACKNFRSRVRLWLKEVVGCPK